MKRFICIISCVLILSLMYSCGNKEDVHNEIENSSQKLQEQAQTLVEDEAEETITEPEVEGAPEPEEEEAPESVTQPEASLKGETAESEPTNEQELPEFSYTVNDAENARGLSTEKRGFSFGVAKDGVPHSQSVINQQTFDAFENVEALALDTKTQEKVMYLTFDNGYEYKNLTADILDTLKEKNVRAAFFITLSYAKQNPQLVQRMINEGHIVGNHSATHPSFPNITRTQMAEEIATLDNYLRKNFSYTSPYFRFPSGEHSECALELVTSIGFKSVFWSIAYSDWDTSAQKGEDYAFSTVTSRFHSGAVILLHTVSEDNARALGRIIDEALSQGYEFKAIDEYSY